MRSIILEEPELEFGGNGRHIDPRFGIATYGPLDAGQASAPERIRVGVIGPGAAVSGIRTWLTKAREPIAAKAAKYEKQRSLFPPFPGFDLDHTFRSLLVFEERAQRSVPKKVIARLATMTPALAVQAAVDAYMEEIDWLANNEPCDIVICARPETLDEEQASHRPEGEDTGEYEEVDEPTVLLPDFHDQLKAAALKYSTPLQVIRPRTWNDPSTPPKGVKRRKVQDEATRAWNLHAAIYYKAGGRPWRLIRSYADTASCYLGASFYRSSGGSTLHTSVAQLFNEKGEGVVVKGGPAAVLKEDRQPHLSEDDAHDLVAAALGAYRKEHGNFPARLVIHKSSKYVESERAGFAAAAEEAKIDLVELVWLSEHDPTRLFRTGTHPPLRGTFVSLADDRYLLYTKGSIDFYGTYPGMYIPAPLAIRPVDVAQSPEQLAAEILALTKLNWNHSQLDGHLPITLHAASKVKAILRHVPEASVPAGPYAHYM
ncbi:MAG: hypothetical protein EDR02_01810 [Actinobacteria bacterium]|nr:MAG: hypothetical protein EDR02_01810 [Actinomycetota bacterium]